MNRPEAPTEFRSIKCSLNTIAFNQDYRENLNRYITIVNDTTMHAFSLLKFILLDELQRDPAFDPFQQGHEQLSVRFFHEVWLSLINRVPATTMSTETAERRAVIQPYNEQYTAIANYTLPTLTYSQQAAEYESEKMLTAYLNNIKINFGNQLRRAVNLLLNVKPRIDSIRLRAMVEQQRTGTVIDVDARIREQVTGPATAFKLAIANRTSVAALRERFVPMDPLFHRVLLYLRPFLESYPQDYAFAENNIYYDCKANPARHFKAYYCLAMVFEQLNKKSLNCFPMRTTWIPCYVTIDTKILLQNIIGERWPSRGRVPPRPIWRRVVNLNHPVFKNQKANPRLTFHYMIMTDGVGVSVMKSRRRPRPRQPPLEAPAADQPEFEYIHRLNGDQQALIQDNCVVVDPGRRDMLFFVHEDSDATTPMRFRFTKSYQNKNEKRIKFRRIRNHVKTRDVRNAEQRLVNSKSYSMAEFIGFIRERSEVYATLRDHYSNTMTDSNPTQHAQHPLHRKLKLSAKFNRDRVDRRLIASLDAKFPGARYIMGNWSAPMAKFQEPTRGLGFRRLLRKHGKHVFLIDEYNTSKVCPQCQQKTAMPFKRVPNPRPRRPHQRRYNATVLRHGLLRCTNLNHTAHGLSAGVYRLWNRDLSACLNMIQILVSVRAGQGIPDRFKRAPQQNNQNMNLPR